MRRMSEQDEAERAVSDAALVLTDRDAIALIRLKACARGCEMMAKHGMKLARNQPSVAELRRQYGITARTNAQAAEQLLALHAERLAEWTAARS